MWEIITNCIIGSTVWLLESNHEDYKSSSWDEEDLHKGVIEGYIVHEQVGISHAENDQVDFLSLAWKADAVSWLSNSINQNKKSWEM